MSFIKLAISILLLSFLSQSAFADAKTMETDKKIKLYLVYGPVNMGFTTPVDVSIVINGQLVMAKNHPGMNEFDSYVEVNNIYNGQGISEAQFNWLIQGKSYRCTADNLPLLVQDGDSQTGTKIHFICQ